jgi:hypothetical protein
MRLWTAVGAWAGLMAVSLALYAFGVSLESRPHAGSSALVPLAIGFGSLATAIFAGDLAYLVVKARQRRRALRAPPREYGALDYEPEFTAAIDRYNAAQGEITSATARTGEAFEKNKGLASQAQADECGNACLELCEVYARLLPEMSENGEIAMRCLGGFLKVSRPTTQADIDALRGLRATTHETRESIAGYLRSVKHSRKTTLALRKKNLSRSLNESAKRLQGHLKDSAGVARATARGYRAAELRMTRRLLWYSVRGRLRPLPSPSLSAAGEPDEPPRGG